MTKPQLLVGLGNPGPDYEHTRHNVGAWLVEAIAKDQNVSFNRDQKLLGLSAKANAPLAGVRLLLPTTFMNHSGQAVGAAARYYRLKTDAIIIAHDDLDLPAGTIKIKQGGGHGGHNGLRDILQHLSDDQFIRIRIGIGHPGSRDRVLNYVLGRPSVSDNKNILNAIAECLAVLPEIGAGNYQSAMQSLHTRKVG